MCMCVTEGGQKGERFKFMVTGISSISKDQSSIYQRKVTFNNDIINLEK